jgi:hypothetical protein
VRPGEPDAPFKTGSLRRWVSTVLAVNPAGLNWPRAVMFFDVVLVPLVVFWSVGHEEYLLIAVFGALFAASLTRVDGTGAARCGSPSSRWLAKR